MIARNPERRFWHGVNARLRRYHRQLLDEVPQELVTLLSRLVGRERSDEERAPAGATSCNVMLPAVAHPDLARGVSIIT